MTMEGLINLGANNAILSQTNQMANQANRMIDTYGEYIHELAADDINLFRDPNIGWLAATGWNGYLYNRDDVNGGYTAYLPQPFSYFDSHEKGGINQFDFNLALNFNDRVYLGLTVGAYDIDYSKMSTYGEEYGDYVENNVNYGKASYEIGTENKIKGSGVDFKFGAIVRPFEDSPFRIGVAIHTPTFYNLTIKTNVRAITRTPEQKTQNIVEEVVDSYDYTNGEDYGYDFRFRTPWKYNFSLGYTYGSSFAIGAEYEYQNYSTMRFSYDDGYEMGWENDLAKMNAERCKYLSHRC